MNLRVVSFFPTRDLIEVSFIPTRDLIEVPCESIFWESQISLYIQQLRLTWRWLFSCFINFFPVTSQCKTFIWSSFNVKLASIDLSLYDTLFELCLHIWVLLPLLVLATSDYAVTAWLLHNIVMDFRRIFIYSVN